MERKCSDVVAEVLTLMHTLRRYHEQHSGGSGGEKSEVWTSRKVYIGLELEGRVALVYGPFEHGLTVTERRRQELIRRHRRELLDVWTEDRGYAEDAIWTWFKEGYEVENHSDIDTEALRQDALS